MALYTLITVDEDKRQRRSEYYDRPVVKLDPDYCYFLLKSRFDHHGTVLMVAHYLVGDPEREYL